MRIVFIASVWSIVLLRATAFSQGLTGETEIGWTGSGQRHTSQFLFFEGDGWSGRFRLFEVEGGVRRAVAGIGPTVEISRSKIKFHLGFTTDQEVMVAGTLISSLLGRSLIYIADGKISTTEIESGLYQKALLAINSNGDWYARVDHLWVGRSQVYIKLGIEKRWKGFFIAPYYDPSKGGGGLGYQLGYRF